MRTRKQRREAAQKKAKKIRITIIAILAACLAVAIVIYTITRPDARRFAVSGGQSVVLYDNGRFVANLFHNTDISGTFTEDVSGDVTAISFTHGGNTVSTFIEDDVLILPTQWRAACRAHSHEIGFPLVP